ncbi:Zinc finger with UFM1-specific peptidase domain protein [Pleurostoma richardsiae]|uniref:Zinc finger with UFM1-specific peptidase domain protein n=1 Tax=Pleurostoma richardsiae TaxID=41990 RepID=A0AA38VDP4_9PEZI|nr:Zinc finger with UFM1-specific peptidase domain protein [Pleurostoma richardsiae]
MADGDGDDVPECPFCGYRAKEGQYMLLMHMEQFHAEGQSPFIAVGGEPEQQHPALARADPDRGGNDRGSPDSSEQFAECPVDGCGEVLLADELEYHIELHREETDAGVASSAASPVRDEQAGVVDAPRSPSDPAQGARMARERRASRSSPRRAQPSSRHPARQNSVRSGPPTASRQESTIQAWRNLFGMHPKRHADEKKKPEQEADGVLGKTQRKRLGKNELGKYAHEKKMPDWLVSHLNRGGQVVGEGIIPVLRQLLEQSPTTMYAYLCHPCVKHISKLKREGGFCGYRNIQMMSSYILGVDFKGVEHFQGHVPSIFDIQNFIEEAWDRGINSQGRVETGGIRGTRKYIGTPEAQAMFVSLQIPCDAQGFKDKEPGKSEERLLQYIEHYFQSAVFNPEAKVRTTTLPPIYFQHAGHSMTIVGLERMANGDLNLLVFDPMFHDAPSITKLVGSSFRAKSAESALKPYRRGNKYLRKYREFEVLRLRPGPETLLPN